MAPVAHCARDRDPGPVAVMSTAKPLPCTDAPLPAASPGAAHRRWRDADGEHLDVRGLPPPQPLVTVLRLLPELQAAGQALTLHHDRDPLLLYPELAELGWSADALPAPAGEVRLLLQPPVA